MANKYKTYADASQAAQRLGCNNQRAYYDCYRNDPMLPSNPSKWYSEEWVDWYHFLGNKKPVEKKYATYAEASKAAQRLGFCKQQDYFGGYRQDPMLPSNPHKWYSEEWVNWHAFLGTTSPEERYYATHAEASEAAQRLGFKTSKEYSKGYKQDQRLPSNPSKIYSKDWSGWGDFLVKARYSTYDEASEAARRIGIKTAKEYFASYRKDPKLPGEPHTVYSEDWVDWYSFLGNDRPEAKYPTYAEASEATQRLGLKSKKEYSEGHPQDPKLPSNPHKFYEEDWEGWHAYFDMSRPVEKYATYSEAAEAAQRLEFRSAQEYFENYQKDPRLPYSPDRHYEENWLGWPTFLQNQNAVSLRIFESYPRLAEAIETYVDSGTNQTAKTNHLRAFLRDIVAKQGLLDDPGAMLSKEMPFDERSYVAFVESTGETQQRPRHNVCVSFFDWIMETYCSDEDDDGVPVPLPGYRNPLRTVLKGYLDQLPLQRASESNKPPLPMESILRAKNYLIPAEARTFRDLHNLHRFLEDNWFEIDPELLDETDPNCVFRKVTKDRKKPGGERYYEEVVELWSPVKIVANYVLFSMPLRGQQICWLDSGEGDEIIPVWRDGGVCWITNTSHLATPKRKQGFLRQGQDGDLSTYITTNKTGKKLGGYSVPYMPEELAYWIIQLREWQSKYNPLEDLTPWTAIKLRQKTNKDILKRRGKQAFLFRDPASLVCEEKVSPMFTTTAFTRTVPALLFHCQRPGEDLAEEVKKKNSTEYKSPFTPHALRVSLITAYIVDGRAPITVISKLVGHSSLVMTIYYTKIGQAHMRRELAAAERRAMERSVDRFQDLILQKKIDEARSELIATDRTTMDRCLTSDWPAAAFQVMNIGICPMGGAKCDEGGELLVERKTEKHYSPVPSGYLGTRNCPRCRFFITGPAFVGGLSAIANEVILEMNVTRKEYHELEGQRQALDDERYDALSAGRPFEKERKLRKVTAAYEEKAKKLDMLACDIQHFYRLITQSTELLNKTETDKHQLIVSDQYVEIGMHLEEQQSDFRLLAEVCANAEIYESASASRAQPLLSQMLDLLADTNGVAPAMFRLPEKEQLKAANQLVQIIMKTAQNDWHLADQLVNGQIMLEDLTEPLKLGDIKREIETVMNGSLKFPLGIESCNE